MNYSDFTVPQGINDTRKFLKNLEDMNGWVKGIVATAMINERKANGTASTHQAAIQISNDLDLPGWTYRTIEDYELAVRRSKPELAKVMPGDVIQVPSIPWPGTPGGRSRAKEGGYATEGQISEIVGRAENDKETRRRLIKVIKSMPDVAEAVSEAFVPESKPKPTELRPIEDQFASVRKLWEHTIERVEAEGGIALADEMREIRDRMKQIEKSVTGKRFRR